MEATFLPSDGLKGKSEGFTPLALRMLLRGDALEGKIQRTFLIDEGTLLPKEGAILVGEGLFLLQVPSFHLEEGMFL